MMSNYVFDCVCGPMMCLRGFSRVADCGQKGFGLFFGLVWIFEDSLGMCYKVRFYRGSGGM